MNGPTETFKIAQFGNRGTLTLKVNANGSYVLDGDPQSQCINEAMDVLIFSDIDNTHMALSFLIDGIGEAGDCSPSDCQHVVNWVRANFDWK